ncbi:MAG: hypothetical protein JWM55_1471 [Acidimicrobiaceae bacterium]|nr:hypothetical protein [Acidimicrobiaceae bacterium]
MPILRLNTQQEHLDANTAKFISISNLLAGIQDFAQGGNLDPNINIESARKIFARGIQPVRTLTPHAKRMLRISWHTELAARILDNVLAASGVPDPDLLTTLRRVSAQTLPVQVYYAIFNSSRCFTLVIGSPCSTHSQVHRDFGNRARGAPGPWGVTLKGDPEDTSSCIFTPVMSGDISFNPMERGHPPNEYLGLALRMTRRWQIEFRRVGWLKDPNNRSSKGEPYKVLPKRGRDEILNRLRPTTLLDLVYELRRRTNYESADEYGSDADDAAVARFHGGLLYLLDSCLLIYEADLARYIGISTYLETAREWRNSLGRINGHALRAFDARNLAIQEAASAMSISIR